MNSEKNYVIGVDFGTDSVRSMLVDAANGQEISSAVFLYPRWKSALYCDPSTNQFRQHPLDYIEGLEDTIRRCLIQAGPAITAQVKAISVDTTGSTPIAVDKTGTPLSLLSGFEENPNAMFVLWKDHTSIPEAAEINAHAAKSGTDYLKYVGGIYSSEWFWAKLLHVLREDEQVRSSIYSWVEHCDWIPFLLTGGNDVHALKRGVCAAGHKALWSEDWGGLPPDSFFSSLDPLLKNFTSRLFKQVYTSDTSVGSLSTAWAKRLGLSQDVVVGVGAFDCHMGAVGGQIEPYYLSKVMGTSTCDMLVVPPDEMKGILVKGICGQVRGSIIPGMVGLEAGQSAFGDAYAWFRDLMLWPLKNILPQNSSLEPGVTEKILLDASERIIPELTRQATLLPLNEDNELALDWLNGRRTPDANQELKGAFLQLDLGTDAARLFRSLVEATCFGARAIIERIREEGIPIKGIIGLGGVAKKSSFIMQVMADVTGMPIRIHQSDQSCALGAAMFAATAAGLYEKVEDAMQSMGPGFDQTFDPDAARKAIYDKRYQQYLALGKFSEQKISSPQSKSIPISAHEQV